MVIRGGENVYPREVEEFLFRHPKVEDVTGRAACPIPKYGEELCAWIRLRAGTSLERGRDQSLLPKARSRTTKSRAMSASSMNFP